MLKVHRSLTQLLIYWIIHIILIFTMLFFIRHDFQTHRSFCTHVGINTWMVDFLAISSNVFLVYVSRLHAGEGCWTEFPNTHSLGSVRNPATNLIACQEACWNNVSCDGVDWNPSQQTGYQCWMIGPWTRRRQVSRPNITQYLINRTHCG